MKRNIIIPTLLLLTALPVSAQKLVISKSTVNVGRTAYQQPVTAVFECRNKSHRKLKIEAIKPDCHCTKVDYPKNEIGANERFQIRMTYDARQLGHFDKQAAVVSNASSKPVYICMKGVVLTEVVDFSKTYPVEMGDLLLDKADLEFDDINKGDTQVQEIHLYNNGVKAYEPNLMHLPSYVTQKAEPAVLQPYEYGEIVLTLESDLLDDYGLIQSSVYLSRFQGDIVGQDNELPLSVVILPDFTSLSSELKSRMPVITLSTHNVNLSAQLAKKTSAKQDIVVINRGKSPLTILKVQVFNTAVGVDLKKNVLEPGESTKLRISVNKRAIGRDNRHLRVLLITNDVQHPKVEINIKAR